MPVYVFVLEPEKKLSRMIKAFKEEALAKVGNQLYLKDAPHSTLYISNFKQIDEWHDEFCSLIEEIKKEESPIKISFKGWHTFEDDPITKKDTLACEIRNNKQLFAVQKKLILFLKKYRNKGLIERYERIYKNAPKDIKDNLDKYGYPFAGKIWRPHISIASFDKASLNELLKHPLGELPRKSYKIEFISIYELDEKDDKLSLVRRYPL